MAEHSRSPSNLLRLLINHGRLIVGWRRAWRFWSVRIATLGAALMTAWPSLPPEMRAALPFADQVATLMFIAVALARVVAQEDGRRSGARDSTDAKDHGA